jgi:AbrB family looped-hinge helix DNA binding protein
MNTALLSPKFEIVIPKQIRKKLNLQAGQRLAVLERDGHIEVRPIPTSQQLIGFLKGPKPLKFERERDREL